MQRNATRCSLKSGSFEPKGGRSFASLIAALCLLTLAGCSTAPLTQQTAPRAFGVVPMPPVPRLATTNPTAGDLFNLTIDLYEYAGECRIRLDSALKK